MYICQDCNAPVTKANRRCKSCAARKRWETRSVSRPYVMFKGKRYYKDNGAEGYWRASWCHGGALLHRDVYAEKYGPLSNKVHIHHKDKDVDNNVIDNLEKLTPSQHAKHHYTEIDPKVFRHPVLEYACKWCGKSFYSSGARPKFCSRHCNLQNRYSEARERTKSRN